MALSPLEKMKVQKELKATKAALMAATNPLDKLKLQKERKALWSKLKGNAPDNQQSVPQLEPEKDDYGLTDANSKVANEILQLLSNQGWTGKAESKFLKTGASMRKDGALVSMFNFSSTPQLVDGETKRSAGSFKLMVTNSDGAVVLNDCAKPSHNGDAGQLAGELVSRINNALADPIINDSSNHGLGLYEKVEIDGKPYVIGGALFNDKTAMLYTPEAAASMEKDLDGFVQYKNGERVGKDADLTMTFSELEKATGRTWGSKNYVTLSRAKKAVDSKYTKSIVVTNAKTEGYLVVPSASWNRLKQKGGQLVYLGKDAPQELASDVAEEAEPKSNATMIIGFSGVDGVQHPSWAHVDDANYEPVLTNLKKGFSLLRRRGDMGEDELYVTYQNGYAGKNFYGASFSSGEAYKLDNVTERKGLQSAVDAPHRSMLERAEKQAVKFLDGAFPIEHGGFSITPSQPGYRADLIDGSALYFGTHQSLAATIADIDSGKAQADIDRREAEFEAEMEEVIQRVKAEKEAGNKASREAEESDLTEFFAITDQGMEGQLNKLWVIIHNLNEEKVKLTGELLEKVRQESKYVLGWDAGAYQPLLEMLIENEELNLDGAEVAPEIDQLSPMLEEYREGKFNNQSADEFKDTMQQVYELGLPVDEVGSGMINWFNANPEQLAA